MVVAGQRVWLTPFEVGDHGSGILAQLTDGLAEPAHRPSSQAPVMWALSASLGWILPVIAQLVWWAVHPQPPWPHLAAAALTAVAMVVHIGVVPLWRYRVHRWEISPQAVFTRTGWLVQERRITPISRVQTVDTYRGPMDRLFGLANVTVTTASSAGAVHIEALDTNVADRVVAQLTDIAALRGEDAT